MSESGPHPKPKSLELIFSNPNPIKLKLELRSHCDGKERHEQVLGNAEQIFLWMSRMGSQIVGDGFVSAFHEYFTPHSFARVCEALEEVGANGLRTLLLEAWTIYTKGKMEISAAELRAINVRRFNTTAKMDRFDEIGEEFITQLNDDFYKRGKVWEVEYAKLHRDEFTPISALS